MIIFIAGGSASGKSEYAESIAAGYPSVTYLATMRNDSKEADRRIARHRRLRGGHPYNVRECFSLEDLNGFIDEQKDGSFSQDKYINTNLGAHFYKENNFIRNNNINNKKQDIVLFDCLSVFAANVLFSEDFYINGEQPEHEKTRIDLAADNICDCISRLAEVCGDLIIVADMIFSDGCVYDKVTGGYIELLGRVCRYAASAADDAVEVVCGIPIMIKGDDYEFLKIHRISDFDVYKDSNAEIGNE